MRLGLATEYVAKAKFIGGQGLDADEGTRGEHPALACLLC